MHCLPAVHLPLLTVVDAEAGHHIMLQAGTRQQQQAAAESIQVFANPTHS
jgi:hypothetical protein